MNDEKVIEFMEEKHISNEVINKILMHDSFFNNEIDLLERIEDIYELLGFAGLTNSDIEKIISKNISILDFSKAELCKLASVLKTINISGEITDHNAIASGIINYKRVFMRNLVVNQTGNSILLSGFSFLTASDYNIYGNMYKLSKACFELFNVWCSSDEELEQCLNNRLKINNKLCTVDDYIKIQSSIFYRRYLQYKNNKLEEKNKGSM